MSRDILGTDIKESVPRTTLLNASSLNQAPIISVVIVRHETLKDPEREGERKREKETERERRKVAAREEAYSFFFLFSTFILRNSTLVIFGKFRYRLSIFCYLVSHNTPLSRERVVIENYFYLSNGRKYARAIDECLKIRLW